MTPFKDQYNRQALRLLAFFVVALLLQSLGRFYFLVAFWPPGLGERVNPSEVLRVLALGARYDLAWASLWCLPALLVTLSLGLPLGTGLWRQRFLAFWRGGGVFLILLGLVVKHFYYYYYRSLFNNFFWEFWLNAENTRLVLWSLLDEIPLFRILALMVGGALLAWFLLWLAQVRLARWNWLGKKRLAPLWVLLLLLGSRGTLDHLPLTMQDFRGQISSHPHLNASYAHPYFSLYNSWDKAFLASQELRKELKAGLGWQEAQAWFTSYAGQEPMRQAILQEGPQAARWQLQLEPLLEKYLKAKPKHVVVIFGESYFRWPSQHPDLEFRHQTASYLEELQQKGLSFDHYYQAGAGTIQNLTKVNLGITTPRSSPNDNTFSEAFQPFPTAFARQMKDLGYRPRFFYGGSLAWHDLGFFAQKAGYDEVISEKDLGGVAKSRFGLFDQDLWKLVADKLKASQAPSFNFVMTLSNHPPYQIPESYQSPVTHTPEDLKPYVEDPELFAKRFRAFAYADQALRRFMEESAKEPWFAETLFVITADHTVHAPFNWPASEELKVAKIPLVFYAPQLLKSAPQVFAAKGTHFDLAPTLISLLLEQPKSIQSQGRSLWNPQGKDLLFSFYLDCWQEVCRFGEDPYLVDAQGKLQACQGQACLAKADQIKAWRQDFDQAGIFYLFNYQP